MQNPVRHAIRFWAIALATVAASGVIPNIALAVERYQIDGDAIRLPLTKQAGDVENGRRVFVDRRRGQCLLCHTVLSLDVPFQGDLGPDLSNGSRMHSSQVRLRLVDPTVVNPETVMPSYYRVEGLRQVAKKYSGKTALTAQEIEDLIVYIEHLGKSDNSIDNNTQRSRAQNETRQ